MPFCIYTKLEIERNRRKGFPPSFRRGNHNFSFPPKKKWRKGFKILSVKKASKMLQKLNILKNNIFNATKYPIYMIPYWSESDELGTNREIWHRAFDWCRFHQILTNMRYDIWDIDMRIVTLKIIIFHNNKKLKHFQWFWILFWRKGFWILSANFFRRKGKVVNSAPERGNNSFPSHFELRINVNRQIEFFVWGWFFKYSFLMSFV